MNIFAKANNNLNLTPGERAILRMSETFVVAGIVAALPVISQALAAQSINWSLMLRTAAATFSVAVLLAVTKYLKAQNDPPLSTAATSIAQTVIADIPRWTGIPAFDITPPSAADATNSSATPAPTAPAPAAALAPVTA